MYFYRYFIYLFSMENLKEKLSKIAPYLNERQMRNEQDTCERRMS